MRYTKWFFICCLVLLFTSAIITAKENKLPLNFVMQPSITGFDRPSAMAITPDGRVYIAERFTGKVFLVRYGKLLATPILTLAVSTSVDEGLLDIAFDRKGPENGYLYIYYTDASHVNKVVRYTLSGVGATDAFTVVTLEASPGASRVGGGLAVGNDGKIYISVGDMEDSADGQNDASSCGKVLRLNPNGTIPADNPTPGSAIYAKGFRDGVGMASHPDVSTLYNVDRGLSTGYDELNAIAAAGNYGWDIGTGPLGDPYTDPLDYRMPTINPSGISSYNGLYYPDADADGTDNDLDGTFDERDEMYDDSVFYGHYSSNDIIRSVLTGANLDSQDSARSFFDADIEWDGTADTLCPVAWTDLDESPDQMIYGLSEDTVGTKDGLYRFEYDRKGVREVSPPGSLFPLTLDKAGSNLNVYWENIDYDAWIGTKTGSTQPAQKYTIWEGTLPISGGTYNHTVKLATNGTVVNNGLFTTSITPAGGNQYYLVSAQGANLEGSLGKRTNGTERTNPRPTMDYCNEIGWYDNELGDATYESKCDGLDNDSDGSIDESCAKVRCAPEFRDKLGNPVKLIDQYGNYWSLHDFRGDVIHLDISSFG